MQGKYHKPLIGDRHQVSHLPPLPPPSRPWAGILPGAAAAAAAATAAAAEVKTPPSSSLGSSAVVDGGERTTCSSKPTAPLPLPAKLPMELENEQTVEGAATAAAVSPLPATTVLSVTASGPSTAAPALEKAVLGSTGSGPAAAHDPAGRAPSYPLPLPSPGTPMVEVAPCGNDRPEAERAAVTVTTESAAAATGSESGDSSPTGDAKPPAAVSALPSMQEDSTRVDSLAVDSPTVSDGAVATPMMDVTTENVPGGETSSRGEPAGAIGVENVNISAEVAVATTTPAVPAATPPTPPPVVNQSCEESRDVAVSTSASSHGPVQSSSVPCPVAMAVAAVTEKLTAAVSMAADNTPAASGSHIPVPAGDGEHKGKLSPELDASASPTVQQSKAAGSKNNRRSSQAADSYSVEGWEGAGSTPALSPDAPEPPEPSSPVKSVPVPALASAVGDGSSASTQKPAGAVAAATKEEVVVVVSAGATRSAGTPPPSVTVSAGVSPALTRPASPTVAGRKRRLPVGGSGSGGNGGGGGGMGAGISGSGRCSTGRGGGKGGSCTLPPPPPPPPPMALPEVPFEDVAELVWDPRSGPKPRGVAEARGQAGTAAGKQALERAMWDRDSTLLERVAPAHAEKSMQVLQTCRHDVERAAQTLTVRHGIHVVGLSSVRTTRNKRAEQQALSPAVRRHCSSLAGSRSGGGGGASGGMGSSSSSGASFEGWQSAVVSTTTTGSVPARLVSAAPAAASRGCKQTDAQGVTREAAKLAGDAFMRYGRDLNAVQKALGWKKKEVVEYYYCVWKYSPAYQVIFGFVTESRHTIFSGCGGV